MKGMGIYKETLIFLFFLSDFTIPPLDLSPAYHSWSFVVCGVQLKIYIICKICFSLKMYFEFFQSTHESFMSLSQLLLFHLVESFSVLGLVNFKNSLHMPNIIYKFLTWIVML